MKSLDEKLKVIICELKNKETKSKQVTFDNHLETFNDLIRKDKTRIESIVDTINKDEHLDFNKNTFKKMLHRARTSIKKQNIEQSILKESPLTRSETIQPELNNEPKTTTLTKREATNYTTEDWAKANVRQPALIKMLNNAGFSPTEINSWQCANEMQISKRMTETSIRERRKKNR
ncbi:hypothetical protein [Photobacterium indicum]|uniref:hypothetical protein n=1 Tax=Photobacterium indicum TaxID=81447 RepID=UPI003D124894